MNFGQNKGLTFMINGGEKLTHGTKRPGIILATFLFLGFVFSLCLSWQRLKMTFGIS